MSMAERRSPWDIRLTPEKRIRGTPTGLTPKQPAKRVALRYTSTNKPSSKRQLAYSGPQSGKSIKIALIEWSLLEKRALVEFVLLHGDGVNWIFTKKPSVWISAAKFIENLCGTKRTSECRSVHVHT